MKLTEHFTLEELIHSEYAARHGLDNRPTEPVLQNLRVLAEGLERVRTVLAVPIHVLSGYRSSSVNLAVGGSIKPPSQHMRGEAADCIAPQFGPVRDACKEIARNLEAVKFDQLIYEFGQWFHVSFSPQNRGEILTAMKGGGGQTIYVRGIA